MKKKAKKNCDEKVVDAEWITYVIGISWLQNKHEIEKSNFINQRMAWVKKKDMK